MISAEALYDTLNRKPFQPFRVYLKDGRIFDIRYRRNNVVSVDFFVIGHSGAGRPRVPRRAHRPRTARPH